MVGGGGRPQARGRQASGVWDGEQAVAAQRGAADRHSTDAGARAGCTSTSGRAQALRAAGARRGGAEGGGGHGREEAQPGAGCGTAGSGGTGTAGSAHADGTRAERGRGQKGGGRDESTAPARPSGGNRETGAQSQRCGRPAGSSPPPGLPAGSGTAQPRTDSGAAATGGTRARRRVRANGADRNRRAPDPAADGSQPAADDSRRSGRPAAASSGR